MFSYFLVESLFICVIIVLINSQFDNLSCNCTRSTLQRTTRTKRPSKPAALKIFNVDEAEKLFMMIVTTTDIICPKKVKFGISFICHDSIQKIYSFGLGSDMVFEYSSKLSVTMPVFYFDPSISFIKEIDIKKVNFFKLGIANINSDEYVPELSDLVLAPQVWSVRTLDHIMRMFQHSSVDLMKLDIGTGVFEVIEEIISKGSIRKVKQLIVTWYISGDKDRQSLAWKVKLLVRLHEAGFKSFHSSLGNETHVKNLDYPLKVEVSYMRD